MDIVLTNADGQSVVFTNGFTYTASQVTFSAPQISGGPTNQSVALGGNTAFSVDATGSDILSYQWFFNSNSVAGATNATLALTNAQPALAGPYFVIVTNTSGAATSSVATLSIPGVPVSLASGAQYSNGQFTFQISGLTGQGPVVIQSSTDFVNWVSILTNAPGFGQVPFMDTNASNPATFYRAVTQSGAMTVPVGTGALLRRPVAKRPVRHSAFDGGGSVRQRNRLAGTRRHWKFRFAPAMTRAGTSRRDVPTKSVRLE